MSEENPVEQNKESAVNKQVRYAPKRKKREPRQPWTTEQHHAFLIALQEDTPDTSSVDGRTRDQFISHKQSYMHAVKKILALAEQAAGMQTVDLMSPEGRDRVPYFISQCFKGFMNANKRRLALFNTPESMGHRIREYLIMRGVSYRMSDIMAADAAPRTTHELPGVPTGETFEAMFIEQQHLVSDLRKQVAKLQQQLSWRSAAARYWANGDADAAFGQTKQEAETPPHERHLIEVALDRNEAAVYQTELLQLHRSMQMFDFPTVLAISNRLISRFPALHRPYLYRAAAEAMLGRAEAAHVDFLQAVQLKPDAVFTDCVAPEMAGITTPNS